MSRPLIGRTVRRLRQEQSMTQQALAARLGISASYLNLIEHDQRAVTASLLIKVAEILRVDLAALSGAEERRALSGLREVFIDPLLDQPVSEAEIEQLAQAPGAARAVLALYRAWRVAREDASGIALPSGRRLLLPHEEARDLFSERQNHFPAIETAAEALALPAGPEGMDAVLAARLREHHGIVIRTGPLQGALRAWEPDARLLRLSERLPRESRGFHLAVQVALLELGDTVESELAQIAPSSPEAAGLLRLGLLNYAAGALLMPYEPFRETAASLRHDLDLLSAHFGVSWEQACHRLSTLQRPEARGVPFFFLRVDPAGNVSKRFSAAGFPFARYGGSCPKWVVHQAFRGPGEVFVQVAQLPDGATFLCFARCVPGAPGPWGEPAPTYVVAMGCDVAHAGALVYADAINLDRAAVGIGLTCRLCDREGCRSRAHPALEHRLITDPTRAADSPYSFVPKAKGA
jgi:predicted transcriptional regulator/DNA-binding XRE family transcriptional regulator